MIFSAQETLVTLPISNSDPNWAFIAVAFIIGSCLGSFVQAAALRLNQSEDVIKQPSRCRSCGQILRWHDNLPILGWVLGKGCCRQCGAKISARYVLIEILIGILSAIMVAYYPLPIAISLILGLSIMMISILTDLDAMLLHLPAMIILALLGAVLSLLPFWPVSPITAFMGLMAPVLLISVINLVYMLIRGEAGFGSGDYWLLGAVGLWMGPILSTVLFFASTLIGALIGVALITIKKGDGQTALPFGVFIGIVFICWPILNILVNI